ncbi:DUF1501 domain-containing protein [Streptomyces parvulus]|uniref:Uncharacterized protein n=1 Tax=Streptomyces parvulus TaxID=146923 RepID=A0A191UTP5_9ACTN|nr:DUF1501 domain-containing protein [Streptomyces parvulus]ANJ06084.1 hypothetical protein Spa2297_03230 [Streptomyces parvulus]GGR62706.1 hypothetical protein GCM10010220_12110 [Streptomyces parvulus]
MDTWTRRKFLTTSGVTAGAALAAGATAYTVDRLLASGAAEPRARDAKILVLVTLYGGNDGLNTVVPASDPAYHDLRPDLAYGEDEVLPLGEGLGLNPGMKGFKGLWDEGQLAVVRGVSYPRPDHSHFRSMSIWQTASPSGPVPTGWLGRWLDTAEDHDPLRAVSVGATLPPLLAGERTAGAAVQLGGARLTAPWQRVCGELARAQDGVHPLQARAAASLGDLRTVVDRFGNEEREEATGAPQDPDEPRDGAEGEDDGGGSAGSQGQLAAQLAVVSEAIRAGVPTRAYSVSLGGFDTHAAEKTTQTRLLGQLDEAVTGFLRQVRGENVVVAVYSEFGRRARANANQGTDHGTSGPVLVLGEPVRGGFHGDQPGLDHLRDDDLATTTDFRDVYATLLERVLDADPGRILDGHDRTLAFL